MSEDSRTLYERLLFGTLYVPAIVVIGVALYAAF
jgi:hypothetical protein